MPRLIRWYTKSNYSHCEIILNDYWISSSPEYGGTKVQKLRPLKDSWDYLTLTLDPFEIENAIDFAFSQENTKYDYWGILINQIFKLNRNSYNRNNKWFCSEICLTLLQKIKEPSVQGLNPSSQSPGDLYRIYESKALDLPKSIEIKEF